MARQVIALALIFVAAVAAVVSAQTSPASAPTGSSSTTEAATTETTTSSSSTTDAASAPGAPTAVDGPIASGPSEAADAKSGASSMKVSAAVGVVAAGFFFF